MKVGVLASALLVVGLTVIAVGAWVAADAWPWLHGQHAAVRIGVLALAVGLAYLAVLLPIGMQLDRAVIGLRRYIEGIADNQAAAGYFGPRWARPITRAFIGAVDHFTQREQALRTQLGDLEIRHRVSEAERRQIEAVLHSLRDGVLVTDAFNEIVMANEAAASIVGFELPGAIHRSIDAVVHDSALSRMIRDARETGNFSDCRRVEQAIQSGADSGGGAGGVGGVAGVIGPRKDQRVFEISLCCVENHKHEVGGVVTILHDLTRERELSQMKSDFVSKASHELRTPLSSIRAYVEMLVDGEAENEESRQEFYRIIHDETDRLGRLIDNMLNISRIEAGIVQIDRENVDMKATINRAVETLEPQAREKGLTLNARLSAVDLCCEGDADMLYQVVLNLTSNAVKYTPEGGRITVAADSDNLTRSIVVSITDTGLGIPPDALPKLFDKFYRVENYKRVAKGTGLGLSLCKHIVETVHHGQIGVESKLGMGSRFWFSVPMRYAGAHVAA